MLFPHLDERQRRLLMGVEARILGHGGVRAVAQAAAVSETTVRKGVDELEAGAEPLGRVRRPGGGRKRAAEVDPGLRPALLALVEPDMRGDPMSPDERGEAGDRGSRAMRERPDRAIWTRPSRPSLMSSTEGGVRKWLWSAARAASHSQVARCAISSTEATPAAFSSSTPWAMRG